MKTPIIVRKLKKHFQIGTQILKAVDDVSFEIYPGEALGLVGESGCGKSTLGKMLLRLVEPTSGEIIVDGENILHLPAEKLANFRRCVQMIFQDPYASLNPRMITRDIITEPLAIHGMRDKLLQKEKVAELLHLVGLSNSHAGRFPHELSGGQRQRVGIARALAVSPSFVVCDEPISALDVSVQAQIVTLLKKLQQDMGLTYLFIAHDLAMVKYFSSRVAVMYLGHIVELASSDELYANPLHPYTQALLSAIPIPDPKKERNRSRIVLKGDIPSTISPSNGCVFASRCPFATERCRQERPAWKESSPGHYTACHLY